MSLNEFNAMAETDAREVLGRCLAVARWTGEVAAKRPYEDVGAALAQAEASAATLSDDEVTSALARHPRIGDRPDTPGAEAELSRREQSGVDPTDSGVARGLQEGNAAYEARFNRVFLIRATGRSSSEILQELGRRLGNDPATEHSEVVGQLREIAMLRLREVLTS